MSSSALSHIVCEAVGAEEHATQSVSQGADSTGDETTEASRSADQSKMASCVPGEQMDPPERPELEESSDLVICEPEASQIEEVSRELMILNDEGARCLRLSAEAGNAAPAESPPRKRPREERRKKGKRRKPRKPPPPETDLDRFLEDTAEKNNLTIQNVKNIIRRVVTNERVLAMLRKSMLCHVSAEAAGIDLDSMEYEPKFTRAKAREIMEKQPHLLWPVSPMKLSSGSSSQKLLQQEFSEESGSDEEYQPASEESEEDTEAPSSVGTCEVFSPIASEAALETPEKRDTSADATASQESPLYDKDGGVVAERTRSKLPLDDTPLEFLEAQFIAPDITPDMYDTDCDDEEWKEFLVSLIKPFEREDVQEDNDAEDPEYNAQEEEDETDSWDLRNDRGVTIPRKELNELVTEVMQVATKELLDGEDEDEITPIKAKDGAPGSTGVGSGELSEAEIFLEATESVQRECDAQPTPRQIQQLEEQMRMHVQLLTQMCLLCSNSDVLAPYFNMSEVLLRELETFALRPLPATVRPSLFLASNLQQAVRLLDWVPRAPGVVGAPPRTGVHVLRRSTLKIPIPSHVRELFAESPVFLYPELLPTNRMYSPLNDPNHKVIFLSPEDHLVALGLEQFVPPRCSTFGMTYLRLIRTFLLPVKTEVQIKVRVKNIIYKKVGEDNPIKYWHVHKVAPPLTWEPHRIDPAEAVAPSQRPVEELPLWMRLYLMARHKRRAAPPAPLPASPSPIRPAEAALPVVGVCSPGVISVATIPVVVHTRCVLTPVSVTLTPAVSPRHHVGTSVSPLKQISPILKKYSQYGRKILKAPAKKRLIYDLSGPSAASAAPGSSSAPRVRCEKATAEEEKAPEQPADERPPDEPLPGAPEEAEDDEGDLAALMAASSTILRRKQALSRKRTRQQRDAQATLPLLEPDLVDADPLKEERESQFAQQYLQRVHEALKHDPPRLLRVLNLLSKAETSGISPAELYHGMAELLLPDHPDVVEDFVSFLLPEQALECGKLPQYLLFSRIRLFLRKLEVHLSQQPQQLQRLLRSLHQLQRQPELSLDSLCGVLQPLLRGQSHLLDELQQLLPSHRVPDSLMWDFEEVPLPEEEEEDVSSCEELTLSPPRDAPGTPQCPCSCHLQAQDPRFLSRARHCTRCGIKFLDGRVFLQTGKVLRPAKVTVRHLGPPEVDAAGVPDRRPSERPDEGSRTSGSADGGEARKGSPGAPVTPWTREEDRILLQACQRMGREKGLAHTAQALGRPQEQLGLRLRELVRLFEASKSDDEDT
ncbi:GON-4-like protein [Ixodes scapularis]